MKVTVKFIGICAHINTQVPNPPNGTTVVEEPDGSVCSIVVPNVSQGLRVNGNPVPPHAAILYIPAAFVATPPPAIDQLPVISDEHPGAHGDYWRMEGVRLELANVSGGLSLAASYCLPSLSKTAGETPPLNDAVVKAGAAACVFRITGGTLDTYQHGEAVLGKLTAEIDGQAALIVTEMWNEKVSTIALQQAVIDGGLMDPVIFVTNSGADTDSSVDFLLHYRVTTFFPDRLLSPLFECTVRKETPDEIVQLNCLPQNWAGLTIGCSNSVYP